MKLLRPSDKPLTRFFWAIGLVGLWCSLSLVAISVPPAATDYTIHGFAALSLCEAWFIWREADRLHIYSGSPLHLFVLTGTLYFVLMPWLSVVLRYHYLITEAQHFGVERLLQMYFWVVLLFFLAYASAIKRTQRVSLVRARVDSRFARRDIAMIWIVAGSILGISAYAFLYIHFGLRFGDGYERLSVGLRGWGWVLRLAELIAIAGLVVFARGRAEGRRTIMGIGLALIVFYGALRMPFENRENVVRFLVIAVMYSLMSSNRRIRARSLILSMVAVVAVLSCLPLLSYWRGGQQLGRASEMYSYFLFRDLNFSEAMSSLLTRDDAAGKVGLEGGAKSILGVLVPRDLWPDKPLPIAVSITSWVTPVSAYDADDPMFAYGTGFLGAAYVIQGVAFCLLTAATLGWLAGKVVRWARRSDNPKGADIRILIAATYSYFGTFAIQKLDPANVSTGLVIPVFFLLSLYVFTKLRFTSVASSAHA